MFVVATDLPSLVLHNSGNGSLHGHIPSLSMLKFVHLVSRHL